MSEILAFFFISLFSGNFKEAGSHEYSTCLMFYLLMFINCVYLHIIRLVGCW